MVSFRVLEHRAGVDFTGNSDNDEDENDSGGDDNRTLSRTSSRSPTSTSSARDRSDDDDSGGSDSTFGGDRNLARHSSSDDDNDDDDDTTPSLIRSARQTAKQFEQNQTNQTAIEDRPREGGDARLAAASGSGLDSTVVESAKQTAKQFEQGQTNQTAESDTSSDRGDDDNVSTNQSIRDRLDNLGRDIAGGADFLAGSTDEAVARTFDDEVGGGIGEGVGDFTGITEFRQTETFDQLKQQQQSGLLGAVDAGTKAGLDLFLDNPNFSVQDTVRGGLEAGVETATGEDISKDEFAEAAAEQAGFIKSIYDRETQKLAEATEDTAIEGVTDTAVEASEFVGGALVFDTGKALTTAATGVDVDEGSAEGTVGAVDAFDIGLTVATGGAGKVAAKGGARLLGKGAPDLLKLGDEGGSLLSRVTPSRGPTAEDFARLSTEGSASTSRGAAGFADEGGSLLGRVRGAFDRGPTAEDFARLSSGGDEAAGAAGRSADDSSGLFTDLGARLFGGADETGARTADDSVGTATGRLFTRLGTRLFGGADEAAGAGARTADDSVGALDDVAEEGGGLVNRVRNADPKFKIGAGVVGGAVGATAVANELQNQEQLELQTQDGTVKLLKQQDLRATEEHPDGGTLWRVDEGTDVEGFTPQGYTVILNVTGRNVFVLGTDGERRQAKASPADFEAAINAAKGAA